MGKIKFPDDISGWEKRSLREDIDTSSEHKHTIYVYKDFAIEHEEEYGCSHWNPYAIINGHPLKLHEGYFHNFDEALGYLKGAIKEKELVDFDNSPDEPEFPKAKTEDMHKGVQLPTAREMFAEAHCLPDADALRQSYREHRSQMYDMLFNARKAEEEKEGSDGDESSKEGKSPQSEGPPPEESTQTDGKVFKKPEDRRNETLVRESPGSPSDKRRITPGDVSFKPRSRHYNPESLVAGRIDRYGNDALERYLSPEQNAAVKQARQDVANTRAQEIAETGTATTAVPRFRGISTVGTFDYDGKSYPLISALSNYGKKFFSKAPGEGGKRSGIYAAIDTHNAMVDNAAVNDPRVANGLVRRYDDDLGNLTVAQIRSLFANGNHVKDPTTGKYTARPTYSEQMDYLGGLDLTKDIFNPDGSLNGYAWSSIQRGDMGEPQADWTPIKWSTMAQNSENPVDYLHISGAGGWSPHDAVEPDYRLARSKFDEVRNNPAKVRKLLNSGMTLNQLNELKKEVSPSVLNSLMGYNFDAGPGQTQSEVEVPDRIVPTEQQYQLDFTPEEKAGLSNMEKKLLRQASAWANIISRAEETGEYDNEELFNASSGLQSIVNKNPEFVLDHPELFDEQQFDMAMHALEQQVHEFSEEQQIEDLLSRMSQKERLDFIKIDLGIDDYKERNGVAHAFWKNASKQQARLILQKLREWYDTHRLDEDQVDNKYASMRGESMDDVMKAKVKQDEKQKGLGDFKDTPESERKEFTPPKPKEGPKIADISGYGDDPDAEPSEPMVATPKPRQVDLSGKLARGKPIDSDIKWSDNPTAPTTQVSLDEVEERAPAPEAGAPHTQLSLDEGWTSTAPAHDPISKIKDYGVNMFGSMRFQDWYKSLMATNPSSPEYEAQLKALEYRLGFDPNLSDLERATYAPLLKRAAANKGPVVKSFREEMEKSISDKDAAAGVPMGFVSTRPMICPYNRVDIGYDKDATYPFELKNALTGEKICDVADKPRDSSN